MPGRKSRSGPRQRPAHIHLIDGTHRTGRHGSKAAAKRERELATAGRAPTPPSWLGKHGKLEWRRLAGALHRDGRLAAKDRVTFAAYCSAYDQLVRAEELLARDGLTTTNSAGGRAPHPAIAAANQARAQLRQLAVEFGLTPLSQPQVKKPSKRKTIAEALG